MFKKLELLKIIGIYHINLSHKCMQSFLSFLFIYPSIHSFTKYGCDASIVDPVEQCAHILHLNIDSDIY